MSTTIEPDVPQAQPPKRKNNGETKLYITAAVVIIGGFLLMYLLSNPPKPGGGPGPDETPTPAPPVTAADVDSLYEKARHQKGDPKAKLTIVEFADFECPSCRRAYENTLKTWDAKMPAHRFGFYHLPLVNMHPRAMPAAVASEAAAKQGKFWEMYNEFFKTDNEELTDATFTNAAKKIGLDMAKFEADLKDQAPLETLINSDVAVANSHGFASTPTFLIRDASGNTVKLAGAGNLKRLAPDLKDGILGNDPLETPDPQATELVHYNIGGKVEDR